MKDLPLVEILAPGRRAVPGREHDLVILLTGDGGWAALDRGLAAAFKDQGVPTVALNSLRYFWKPRIPEQVAFDLGRVITHYLQVWRKSRIILVGYSFGADVLPFALNRLPAALRSHIATVNLLGLSATAAFEIRIMDWIRATPGLPVAPQLQALSGMRVLCLFGRGDDAALGDSLPPRSVIKQMVGKGHHFSGEYAVLAERILAFLDEAQGTT
ncbi:MAG TPA: AcvB/VirJ family lysyl-phosphatidylglycerol hydrolase [Steroidobacteraceae bacterium]|nr:AcvB/VirJ family lysyl-phosphatidylglycerol hydrolase [Steroidobacteraceae bacterium]